MAQDHDDARRDEIAAAITDGRTSLGIELGSTRIKACLIGPDHAPLASGSHEWENQLVDGVWTYSLDAVWAEMNQPEQGAESASSGHNAGEKLAS